MTPVIFVVLALAGGVGAVARFGIDSLIRAHTEGPVPLGTVVINLSGSLALGMVTGVVGAHAVPEAWQLVLGVGFLGGYTTFSTASVETVELCRRGYWRLALVTGVGVLLGGTGLAALGLLIGSHI